MRGDICDLYIKIYLLHITYNFVFDINVNIYTLNTIFNTNICITYKYAYIIINYIHFSGFPGGSDGKASACSAGDLGLIPGLGRSPREGNGNPLQYSCLENSMD